MALRTSLALLCLSTLQHLHWSSAYRAQSAVQDLQLASQPVGEAIDRVIQVRPEKRASDGSEPFDKLRLALNQFKGTSEDLDAKVGDATEVFMFLLDIMKHKKLLRQRVLAVIEKLVRTSSSWAAAAQVSEVSDYAKNVMRELNVLGEDSYGDLERLPRDKVNLMLDTFSIRFTPVAVETSHASAVAPRAVEAPHASDVAPHTDNGMVSVPPIATTTKPTTTTTKTTTTALPIEEQDMLKAMVGVSSAMSSLVEWENYAESHWSNFRSAVLKLARTDSELAHLLDKHIKGANRAWNFLVCFSTQKPASVRKIIVIVERLLLSNRWKSALLEQPELFGDSHSLEEVCLKTPYAVSRPIPSELRVVIDSLLPACRQIASAKEDGLHVEGAQIGQKRFVSCDIGFTPASATSMCMWTGGDDAFFEPQPACFKRGYHCPSLHAETGVSVPAAQVYESAPVQCPMDMEPTSKVVTCGQDGRFFPKPTCVPADNSGQELYDITAHIQDLELHSPKSPRCCCDADGEKNVRCEIFSTHDKCGDLPVYGENLAWVKARRVRRVFFMVEVKELHHYRHHGQCLVPMGRVREYYVKYGSPANYCPAQRALYGIPNLKYVAGNMLLRSYTSQQVECKPGYRLMNQPRCLYADPMVGIITPAPICEQTVVPMRRLN